MTVNVATSAGDIVVRSTAIFTERNLEPNLVKMGRNLSIRLVNSDEVGRSVEESDQRADCVL